MEYAEKGDLAAAIRRRRQTLLKYKEYELWALFKILCSAVKHLHENSVIHRDIKLENIFVTKDNIVKLGDLGLSKIL
jgi:NIMA (never in mitosis gene a)-related kinase